MKYLIPFLLFFLLTSCAARYQVITTFPTAKTTIDSSLVLDYDFWVPGGKMHFIARNTTDKIITLYVDKCFIIMNGFSTCYYKGQTITKGSSQSVSVATPVYTKPFYTVGANNKINSSQRFLGISGAGSQEFSSVTIHELKTI
jgi:hypothetical protein